MEQAQESQTKENRQKGIQLCWRYQVSPFALNPEEYQLISEETKKTRDLKLASNMEDIQISSVVINNMLNLIFHIQIF
jgi:hypothetical protein